MIGQFAAAIDYGHTTDYGHYRLAVIFESFKRFIHNYFRHMLQIYVKVIIYEMLLLIETNRVASNTENMLINAHSHSHNNNMWFLLHVPLPLYMYMYYIVY